ncbi:MAG: hypothetical protein QXF76_01610 [Candidatus Anstonellales archaeon]
MHHNQNNKNNHLITEGRVKLFTGTLFYNPNMRFCRNLFTLALSSLNENRKLVLLDGFCSSGIRGFRYLTETEKVKELHFVDVDSRVKEVIHKNIELNSLQNFSINYHQEEFNRFLRIFKKKFDFIEIDPFGSPLAYLESAIHSLNNNGYLSITATDTQVLCGSNNSACRRYYGSKSLNNFLCHELSLRILLKVIVQKSSEQGKGIIPLLSVADRHYVKILCKLENSSKKADMSINSLGYINFCQKCHYFEIYQLGSSKTCKNCNSNSTILLGPMWLKNLSSEELLYKMREKLGSISYLGKEELKELNKKIEFFINDNKQLLFYDIHKFCSVNKLRLLPTNLIVSRLMNKGYQVFKTSFSEYGLKGNFSYNDFISVFKD